MEQILPRDWALVYYGLILCVTMAQMLVVYVLSDARTPPAGLGMYTVYFMAALLGWIALTLQQGASTPVALDVSSVAAIMSAYTLFLAAGQRAGATRGRLIFGVIALLASLSAFFLSQERMFAVQSASVALFFAGAGCLAAWRAWNYRNIGDAIITAAALVLVAGTVFANYRYARAGDLGLATTVALGSYGTAHVLIVIGFLASVLIEYQQQLSHLATEDPLTRLPNRRGLEEALRVSLATASRRQLPTSAIMVDIDHFRQINETFGHDLGDRLLQQLARLLLQQSRGSDVVARIGGEEFLLVLPDSDLDATRVMAERIRQTVGDNPLRIDQHDVPVTVSLGVAGVRGDVDLDELRGQAERAIYLAKRGGRNRVASVERSAVHLTTAGSETS